MLEDVRAALAIDNHTVLSDQERTLWDGLTPDLFLQEGEVWDSRLAREFQQSCNNRPGQELSLRLARRFYWHTLYCLKKKNFHEAWPYLKTIRLFLGIKGLARTVRYKIGRNLNSQQVRT
jgi:hypothetical protein